MAKKSKKAAKTTKLQPQFEVNTVVSGSPSLVVDKFGIAWWVDPFSGTIRRATA